MRRRQAGNFHVAINIPEELLVLLLLHYIYIEHVKARNLHILLFQGIWVSLIKCGKLEIFLIYESFFKCHFKDISISIYWSICVFHFYYDSKVAYKFYRIKVDEYGCDVCKHEPFFYLWHRRRSTSTIVTTIKNKLDTTKGIVARFEYYNSYEAFQIFVLNNVNQIIHYMQEDFVKIIWDKHVLYIESIENCIYRNPVFVQI